MTVTIWDTNAASEITTLNFDEAFYNVNYLIKISFWSSSTLSLAGMICISYAVCLLLEILEEISQN